MKLFNNWYPEDETKQFIEKSTPTENSDLRLCKGEEDAGWVRLYFRYNENNFEVLMTLATSDLSDIVIFFENMTDLKEDAAIYLDNEIISTPLLYVSPVDNERVRFLVADGKRVRDLWKEDKISDEEYDSKGLSGYDVRCDVIVEKKKLLKEFYRAIKNIINTCTNYDEDIYDIGYPHWKDKLRNIINYAGLQNRF